MILYTGVMLNKFILMELNFDMEKTKPKKRWIIVVAGVIILGVFGLVLFYQKNVPTVFTQSEYIKEVIIQNQSFNDTLDKFLDEVTSYDGSKEDTEKLENTANKLKNFVNELEKQLGPKVPTSSKEHYQKMIEAYNMYLEGIEMYKKAVPKNLGEERNIQIKQAQDKISEAKKTMKNLK